MEFACNSDLLYDLEYPMKNKVQNELRKGIHPQLADEFDHKGQLYFFVSKPLQRPISLRIFCIPKGGPVNE